jgi:hypothetical protein
MSTLCSAQFVFKAEGVATKLYSEVKQDYDEWSEWRLSDVIILIDLDSSKIEIFSQKEQKFIIIGILGVEGEKGKELLFECLDQANTRCTSHLIYLKEEEAFHLYFRWKYLQVVYQMKKVR